MQHCHGGLSPVSYKTKITHIPLIDNPGSCWRLLGLVQLPAGWSCPCCYAQGSKVIGPVGTCSVTLTPVSSGNKTGCWPGFGNNVKDSILSAVFTSIIILHWIYNSTLDHRVRIDSWMVIFVSACLYLYHLFYWFEFFACFNYLCELWSG